jgi:hexosaminidase
MLAAIAGLAVAQPIAIVPRPLELKATDTSFTCDPRTVIVSNSKRAALTLQDFLRPATGYPFEIRSGASSNVIELKRNGRYAKDLGDEGYALKVGNSKVLIQANTDAGLFYGSQTLRQLLPADIYRSAPCGSDEWVIQGAEIKDVPRFKWRGGMLDTCRNFMPKEFVMKFIDLLALHKMNSFHWHLTDDQGWRIEIKQYPKLTEVGAWRSNTMTKYNPAEYTNRPHGGYYTQDDIREIVAYAKARFINVVPEIEMPGHAQAAIASYPWLGNNPTTQLEVATKWGVIENVFNTEDSTIHFLQNVIDEVIDLFPGQFIHIGGDECPKTQWKASDRVQEKMKQLGLKDEKAMQSWFIGQMDKYISSKGRRLIGWSEILEGGLADNAALMVWLDNEGAMEAVSSGHDVVMAQTTHTYLDYYQSRDTKNEPWAIGGYLPLDKVYSYEPILPKMTPDQAKHVMGVQFQIWTEYIRDGKHVEYMAYPRACALSEVAWSARENRDYGRFSEALPLHLARLKAMDVNFRKLDAGSTKN